MIAVKLRATKTHAPEGLDSVRAAYGFSNWMFESLSHGLVKVPNKEMEDGVSAYEYNAQLCTSIMVQLRSCVPVKPRLASVRRCASLCDI